MNSADNASGDAKAAASVIAGNIAHRPGRKRTMTSRAIRAVLAQAHPGAQVSVRLENGKELQGDLLSFEPHIGRVRLSVLLEGMRRNFQFYVADARAAHALEELQNAAPPHLEHIANPVLHEPAPHHTVARKPLNELRQHLLSLEPGDQRTVHLADGRSPRGFVVFHGHEGRVIDVRNRSRVEFTLEEVVDIEG